MKKKRETCRQIERQYDYHGKIVKYSNDIMEEDENVFARKDDKDTIIHEQ